MTGTVTVPYTDPANEVQWADDFLTYINAPVNDQSLAFITAAELEEGVFHPNADFVPRKYGDDNKNNPLDSTQFEAGGVVWAENGGDPVWQFPTLQAGLESNASIIENNPGDLDLLEDLRKGNKTAQELAADIAVSDWGTGGGPYSAAEEGYSTEISGLLQEALADIKPGLAGKGTTATLTGIDWGDVLIGPGGYLFKQTAGAVGGAVVDTVQKDFLADMKRALPYVLEVVGVIAGGGLILLGAYKAAGRKSSEVPGVGAIINMVQKHPEMAEAAA